MMSAGAASAGQQRFHLREILASLLVTVVLSFLIYLRTDVHELTSGFSRTTYPVLLAVLLLLALGWSLRAARWGVLLSPFCATPTRSLAKTVLIGGMLSAIVPARAGEFWRAHTVGRQEGLSRSTVFGTILVERVLDGLILALLAMVGALAVRPTTALAVLIGSMMLVFSIFLALFAYFVWSPQFRAAAIAIGLRVIPQRFRALAEDKTGLLVDGLGSLRDGRVLGRAVAFTLLVYTVDAIAYWTLGENFGLHASPLSYLMVVAVANLAVAVPLSVGGVGPYEFFLQQDLVILGVPSSLALAYGVFMHALTLAFIVASGLLLLAGDLSGFARRKRLRPLLGAQAE